MCHCWAGGGPQVTTQSTAGRLGGTMAGGTVAGGGGVLGAGVCGTHRRAGSGTPAQVFATRRGLGGALAGGGGERSVDGSDESDEDFGYSAAVNWSSELADIC